MCIGCPTGIWNTRVLHRVLDTLSYRFLPVCGTVDTSKVCPRAIWGINTCHHMRHSLSLPTVTCICMRELPHSHHGRQRRFCTLSRFKLLQVDQGSPVPLAKCSFGMIPLSRHSVDRSPRAFHSSTHNVVRASCFEVVSASVESRKLFLDGSLCLAGRWPWSVCLGSSYWRQRSALLATFRRMWGRAIPASANKQGIGVAFKQPVIIINVSFRAISTCPVCLERPHEEQANSAVEKQRANAVVRTVAG